MFLLRIRAQKSVTRRLLSLWAVALLVPVFGCKDSVTNRFDVAGMVTFEGKPVPAGMIYFSPHAAERYARPYKYSCKRWIVCS